jgi:hypothetical protein
MTLGGGVISHIFQKFACCGAEMLADEELEKTITYKCKECSLSDSKLK